MKKEIEVVESKELTAESMKQILWEAMLGMKSGETSTKEVTALTGISGSILNSVKTQCLIAKLTHENVVLPQKVIDFGL